jgi:hypothetical protein
MRGFSLLLVLAAAAAASPVLAQDPNQDGGSRLVLQSPAGAPAHVIIDGAAWVCEGAVCTAGPGGMDQPVERACRRVVRELGPVTAFAWQGRSLAPEKIAACNAAAAKR